MLPASSGETLTPIRSGSAGPVSRNKKPSVRRTDKMDDDELHIQHTCFQNACCRTVSFTLGFGKLNYR